MSSLVFLPVTDAVQTALMPGGYQYLLRLNAMPRPRLIYALLVAGTFGRFWSR